MTFPRATLMFVLYSQSGAGIRADTQSGNVSASSADHAISTTRWGTGGELPGSMNRASWVNVTLVNRTGQTTVDMANGPVQRVQPFPETIKLLEKLGAKNNHKCVSC